MVWCFASPLSQVFLFHRTMSNEGVILNAIEERIDSLNGAIGRMSALLDSMLPRSTSPDIMGNITTGRYERHTGWPASVDGDGFEREEMMSDVSEDDTVEYMNEYDFGDIDEDTDDITFVPPWCVPYGYDRQLGLEITPPAQEPRTEPPPIYRPRYLDDEPGYYWN